MPPGIGYDERFFSALGRGAPRLSPEAEEEMFRRLQEEQDIAHEFRRPDFNAISDSLRQSGAKMDPWAGPVDAQSIFQEQRNTRDANLDSALAHNQRSIDDINNRLQDPSRFHAIQDSMRQSGAKMDPWAGPAGASGQAGLERRRDREELTDLERRRRLLFDQTYPERIK